MNIIWDIAFKIALSTTEERREIFGRKNTRGEAIAFFLIRPRIAIDAQPLIKERLFLLIPITSRIYNNTFALIR